MRFLNLFLAPPQRVRNDRLNRCKKYKAAEKHTSYVTRLNRMHLRDFVAENMPLLICVVDDREDPFVQVLFLFSEIQFD